MPVTLYGQISSQATFSPLRFCAVGGRRRQVVGRVGGVGHQVVEHVLPLRAQRRRRGRASG